ncbi:hypothetical protein RJ639_041318 [Escallonia herrerae]|uniref:Integrase catalytic domain-containing protein n=1 Tax=Escallonia herrerae TaxID=1293975 RepID=A0AA88WIS0_9ASTE|nr:hypothetical protein RJ639_041318 [Escallonia herrerae]
MDPIVKYLYRGELPSERHEAQNLRFKAARYALMERVLYKKSFRLPYLRCLPLSESLYALQEVHEGICGQHLGGRTLAKKILRQGYYWPTMQKDVIEFTLRCDKYYFTKWTEAEALETITSAKCEDFFWKNVVCRFGVPKALVVDNGRQFNNGNFKNFYTNLLINLRFTSFSHPQSNGQTENMNRSILQGLKKRLDEAKGGWVNELPKVLWAYQTTPHSVIGETPFLLCYGTEAMLPVEVGVPTIRALHFNEADNELEVSDPKAMMGKLSLNWEEPYRVIKVLKLGAYTLGTVSGDPIPHTYNAENLRKYYQ